MTVCLDECHSYSSEESVHDAVINDAGTLCVCCFTAVAVSCVHCCHGRGNARQSTVNCNQYYKWIHFHLKDSNQAKLAATPS